MGPIQPLTDRYILTLLGFVTEYPKAVLLKGPKNRESYGSSYLYKLYNWCFERNVDDQNKQLKLELKIKLKLELIAKT